jgi:hypothetical protein
VSLKVGRRRDQKLESARNTKFRQVRAAESIIPYVVCVVCIALGIDVVCLCLEGVPARSYIVWGDKVTWKS